MSYFAGLCAGIVVEVTGKTPEALDRAAIDVALRFFGKPAEGWVLGVEPYLAEPDEQVRDGMGRVVETVWKATVTVRLRKKAPRFNEL